MSAGQPEDPAETARREAEKAADRPPPHAAWHETFRVDGAEVDVQCHQMCGDYDTYTITAASEHYTLDIVMRGLHFLSLQEVVRAVAAEVDQ
jgi:hypothetical protein